MTTKLTLTVEKEVIDRAKIYAKSSGRSLSEMVENYLNSITLHQQNPSKKGISNKLHQIVGAVKIPKDFNEKNEMKDYLRKKHS